MIKKLLFIFLFNITLFLSISSYAKVKLDVSSLTTDLQLEIQKRFKNNLSEIPLNEIDDLIRFIHSKHSYRTIFATEITSNTGEKIVKLTGIETKKIRLLTISGSRNFSKEDLHYILKLNNEDIFEMNTLTDGVEKLTQNYNDLGYRNVNIDYTVIPITENQVDINIKIAEGPLTEIDKIDFQTENNSLKTEISNYIKNKTGSPLTESNLSEIQKLIKEFLNKNLYLNSEVTNSSIELNADETKARVIFNLTNPTKYIINFSGYFELTSKNILDQLELENYYSANPNVGSEMALRIKKIYLSNGYARAEVQYQEEKKSTPYTRILTFIISEGPKVRIEKISIVGQYSMSEGTYADLIKKNSSKLVKKGFYSKEDIDNGIKKLLLDRQNSGYLVAKIGSIRTQYSRMKDSVTIVINFDEGPLTSVEKIQFEGNNSFKDDILASVIDLKENQPIHLNEISSSISKLKEFYNEQGYLEMTLLNEKESESLVSYNEDNTKAKIKFNIYEGPKVFASSIILEGNSFTKDYVIYNELEFKNGDILTPYKINESIARLQRTGYFSSVEIRTLEEKTNVSQRTVIIKVSEQQPGVFTLGVGANNERQLTFRGYTGVAYRNLLGTGRGVSLRLEGNYNVYDIKILESKITLGYLEPYLFNTKFKGRINLTRSKSVTDYELKKISEVNQTTYSIERAFSSHFSAIWDAYSLATVYDYSIVPNSPVIDSRLDIATTGTTLDLDYRDNPFNPTKGTFTRFNAEYSTPKIGSSDSIEYYRLDTSFTHYLKLNEDDWIWANLLRFGYVENLNKLPGGGVPYDKKGFILGGRPTVRGYEAGTLEVFPNTNDLGSANYNLTTNATMKLLKSEVRFPIPYVKDLGGAVFYDGGSVKIAGLDLANSYIDSVGFGVRYLLPVGTATFEVGWKLRARPNESPLALHISFGSF